VLSLAKWINKEPDKLRGLEFVLFLSYYSTTVIGVETNLHFKLNTAAAAAATTTITTTTTAATTAANNSIQFIYVQNLTAQRPITKLAQAKK
jgi:hypothetical protein